MAARRRAMTDMLVRGWTNLVGRVGGPMTFRLVVQPIVAAILALRAGSRDARADRRPYFWAIVLHPLDRRELLREGWRDVAKVFVMAVVIDCIYQILELRWIYPGEALIVAAMLALVPYLLIRGATNRIARLWHRAAARPG